MNKYKVRYSRDNTYVVVVQNEHKDEYKYTPVFFGSLTDCDAYIRLMNEGYM